MRERAVYARHNVPGDGLRDDAANESSTRAEFVADERAEDGAGKVERVDQDAPGEGLPGRRVVVPNNVSDDRGGVDGEGEGREIVDEPDRAHDEHAEAVHAQDEQPGRARLLGRHFLALEGFWLLQLEAHPDQG